MHRSWVIVVGVGVALLGACGEVASVPQDFDSTADSGAPGDGGDEASHGDDFGRGDAGGGGAVPPSPFGCADGTRETFTDLTHYPAIAGCQGGFTVPGVTTTGSQSPQCGRQAGNTAPQNQIDGCSVADLCAEGWHVCASAEDVFAALASGPKNAAQHCDDSVDGAFWITRQAQTDGVACAPNAHNNVVGCGPLGTPVPSDIGCGPLDRFLDTGSCGNGSAWECGGSGGTAALTEADVVVKRNLQNGGALCCRDR